MRYLVPLVVACAVLISAAPAGAVIGGERIDYASVPTFTSYGCGGTLVAPDRVVTAIHCLTAYPFSSIENITVGGLANKVTRVSMHPSWRQRNGPSNFVNDVAIMQLETPVSGVTPAVLGDATAYHGKLATIVGSGLTVAPGSRQPPGAGFGGGLRVADLKVMSDPVCKATFGTAKGNAGEVFMPKGSFCAIDADGKAPLKSGCNGDSGGPLFAGPPAAPILLGVVSYGGRRCGADHLPSVFAEVSRFRSFITDPAPVWAPRSTTPAKVTGPRRAGGKLTCSVADVPPGARVLIAWKRFSSHGSPRIVSTRASYKVRDADRGARFVCFASVSNDGGFLAVPEGRDMVIKIPR